MSFLSKVIDFSSDDTKNLQDLLSVIIHQTIVMLQLNSEILIQICEQLLKNHTYCKIMKKIQDQIKAKMNQKNKLRDADQFDIIVIINKN